MMAIYHKEGNTSAKNLDRHMLGFKYLEKIRGIRMEIYPLVIITKTRKFYVSQILIDGDISCDILYSEFFQNMNLDQSKLPTHKGLYLQVFNKTTTRPWGYVELIASVGSGDDIRALVSQYLVVPCRSVYNFILG